MPTSEGGALEGLGRFFSAGVALLLYPMIKERFLALLERVGLKYPPEDAAKLPDIIPMNAVQVQEKFRPLFQYLFQSKCVRDIPCGNSAYLSIDTAKVFEQMKAGDEQWTQAVPPAAAKAIKKHAAIYHSPASEVSPPLLSE